MPEESAPAQSAARQTAVPPLRMPAPPRGAPPASDAPSTDVPFKPDNTDRSGNARDALQKRMEKVSTPQAEPPPAPADRKPPEDIADRPGAQEEPPKTDGDVAAPSVDSKLADKPVDKRKNPWKLYEDEKKARAVSETELQRLKSERIPEQDRTALTERATRAEKRNQELEDHIRFVDYQKSSEFQTKYEQPYVEAWNQAVAELSEITVADAAAPNGQRAVTPDDVWNLVNMPLGTAQDVAEEAFGKFASVAMQHRAAIKKLLLERNKAVEEAKTKGGERIKQQQEAFQANSKATIAEARKLHQAVNEEIMKDPASSEFLKPFTAEEGQELPPEQKEWNEFLEKGYQLVDEAWSQNPLNPALKPEERRAVIARYTAIRNRAAAFGPLKRAHKRALKQIAEMQRKLDDYAGSTPTAGGRRTNGTPSGPPNARDSFLKKLESISRR